MTEQERAAAAAAALDDGVFMLSVADLTRYVTLFDRRGRLARKIMRQAGAVEVDGRLWLPSDRLHAWLETRRVPPKQLRNNPSEATRP